MKRENSIDIVRGIVMIIMALDHVRDLMHIDSITQSPTDLATTTPFLFFTRWITHLCAPTFVFLAGTSVYLSLKSKNNFAETRQHLIKRGLWLLLLEFTVVNFGLFFDIGFHTLLFQVIAAIGFGFILLGLLLKIPAKQLGIIGLVIIFGHNLLPLIPFAEGSIIKAVLAPFFSPAVIPFGDRVFIMGYPPIPWLGIMLTGFSFARYFEMAYEERKKVFIKLGLGSLLLFVILRFINIYGDPALWTIQKDTTYTFISFMNVTKYAPSLLYCLPTLGIMLLLLAFAEQFNNGFKKVTIAYGKVPLFYFVLHFYVIHILNLAMLFLQGFNWSQLEFATGTFGRPKGVESGLPLWSIYLIWFAVVAFLYKPCIWFGAYKAKNKHWWLRYI
ncbi:putative membrane protein [Flavobacterium chryseum]|uniref:DUF1624 domain-containing protein n=1 Tax=Flavobacterium sp. P3160 TaxID=2512113 RepID=UPI00105F0F8B|nr:heparan-alpha-glucosaminide N-acetyltransferase domain-containing protein [Flavobacterium sp. P3160]TDO70444.1 putative membrane protein [Flavobacterium sp. P3160]